MKLYEPVNNECVKRHHAPVCHLLVRCLHKPEKVTSALNHHVTTATEAFILPIRVTYSIKGALSASS